MEGGPAGHEGVGRCVVQVACHSAAFGLGLFQTSPPERLEKCFLISLGN